LNHEKISKKYHLKNIWHNVWFPNDGLEFIIHN